MTQSDTRAHHRAVPRAVRYSLVCRHLAKRSPELYSHAVASGSKTPLAPAGVLVFSYSSKRLRPYKEAAAQVGNRWRTSPPDTDRGTKMRTDNAAGRVNPLTAKQTDLPALQHDRHPIQPCTGSSHRRLRRSG